MYHFIINPAARSGRGLTIWKEQVEPLLHQKGTVYRCHFSEKPGDVAELMSEILASAREFPVPIIILGGDGTVNEALQGIADTSKVERSAASRECLRRPGADPEKGLRKTHGSGHRHLP